MFRMRSYDNWPTNQLFPSDAFVKPRNRDSGERFYESEGFLSIQQAIANAYATHENKTLPLIFMKALPYPSYTVDPMIEITRLLVPIFFIMSFNYAFVNTVRFIAIEKEKQLTEFMQMHGMSRWLIWSSWLIRTLIMQFFTITCIVIVCSVS